MENFYQLAKSIAVNLLRGSTGTLTRQAIAESVALAISLKREWQEHVDAEALVRDLESQFSVWIGRPQTLDDPTNHVAWLPQKRGTTSWAHWERYRELLKETWPPASVDRLDEATDEVLERLEDPARPGPWDRRGLVVGHVQSGKTANYIGLINKAVDAGYRLIVVLAGIHKSLRSQTQIRLDEGFLGYESVAAVAANQGVRAIGVGRISPGLRPNTITIALTEFLKVFLRWLKHAFTTLINNFSSQSRCSILFRVNLITPDFTFGGGEKTCSGTVNRYSVR